MNNYISILYNKKKFTLNINLYTYVNLMQELFFIYLKTNH